MAEAAALLPAQADESAAQRRLREAINRDGAKMLRILDAALALRTAPAGARRERHRARDFLKDFAASAMTALALKETGQEGPR